ncbi:MAG: hypothetical protein IKB04_01930 [Clostridia bacterium]|nr:hypothetical protein [Clostridia bacterium]
MNTIDNKFLILLKDIKERPGLYLGQPSLELLHAFLNGYSACRMVYQVMASPEERHFFSDFSKFVCDYFDVQYQFKTDDPWVRVIRLFSTTDRRAFYAFFDLLDLFIAGKQVGDSPICFDDDDLG